VQATNGQRVQSLKSLLKFWQVQGVHNGAGEAEPPAAMIPH